MIGSVLMTFAATGSVFICVTVFSAHEMERERIIAINAGFIDAGPAKYDRVSSLIIMNKYQEYFDPQR